MAKQGRPKKDDSRDKQYRVRLNDQEARMLAYASQLTQLPKSEIFRNALEDYFNKVRLAESEGHEVNHISLQRAVECPHCSASNVMDFAEDCSETAEERPMGDGYLFEFEWEDCKCASCGRTFRVSGRISEYPVGVFESEDIKVTVDEVKEGGTIEGEES